MDPLTVGLTLASIGGGILNNRANAREARRNREFQAQQSGSAAQRSVADFRAAGLNPALAYGTTASTPAGSTSTQQDAVTSGIASARDASQAKQAMELARREQDNRDRATAADVQLKGAQMDAAHQQASLTEQQKQAATRENMIGNAILPNTMQGRLAEILIQQHLADKSKSDATIRRFEIPEARNKAAIQNVLGTWGAALPFISGSAGAANSIVRMLTRR